MPFTVFAEFENISRHYSYFFSFTSFSPHFFKTLHLGFEVYKKSKYKQTSINKDQMSFKECFEAVQGFKRRLKDVSLLKKPTSWEQFSEKTDHNLALQKQLDESQENFKNHQRFAAHTNQALLDAYEKLITLEKLLFLAQKDLIIAKNRRYFGKLSLLLHKKYEIYLAQQLAVLQKEKDDITANMFRRLFLAAQDPSLENTDTLAENIKQLKSRGFLKSDYKIPKISDEKLSKAQFYRFHEIINNLNNTNATILLRSLPWFKNNANLAERFGVSDWMPETLKSPNFLFYNANIRFKWFDDYYIQAHIDASLNYLQSQKVKGELTLDSLSYRIIVINSAEQGIHSELLRIYQARMRCQIGLRKLFSKTTLEFLHKIEIGLYDQYLLLISEKVIFLDFLSVTSEEHLQSIDLAKFITHLKNDLGKLEGYFGKAKLYALQQQFNASAKILQKYLDKKYKNQLKEYLCQWLSLASQSSLDQKALSQLNKQAEDHEKILLSALSEDWITRIENMKNLRVNHKFFSLVACAQENLIHLLGVKPEILRASIKKELTQLKESLIYYIKHNIQDFDYKDQKHALSRIITLLTQEAVLEAESSILLTADQKAFLADFPEINFYINSLLKLNQTSAVLAKLYNPKDIEEHLKGIYRFIQHQEAKFLSQKTTKFIDLFSITQEIKENRTLINQLKMGVL